MTLANGAAQYNRLYRYIRPSRWTAGIGAELPEEYKKFWKEWKLTEPTPVYWVPREEKYERNQYGEVKPIQNRHIPLKYPKELDKGIWGGEAVVQGFIKKSKYHRRYPRYWVPMLQKSIVYSEILDKYMRTTVTERTLDLIHKNYGFDHYLLKTPACDLRSLLALHLKRQMLLSLADKTLYPDDPIKRDEIYDKYKHYLDNFTRTEIEWYGLSWKEACDKHVRIKRDSYNPIPLKVKYREELINELKAEKFGTKSDESKIDEDDGSTSSRSWVSRINPFSSRSSTKPEKN